MLMADASSPGPWSVHLTFRIELKAVAFLLVISTTLLYYTHVKFNQAKNETGIRSEATQALGGCAPAAVPTIRSIKGIRRSGQDFWSGRFVGCGLFPSGPNSA